MSQRAKQCRGWRPIPQIETSGHGYARQWLGNRRSGLACVTLSACDCTASPPFDCCHRMRPAALALLTLLAAAVSASLRPAVVGYLPEWRYNAASFTHLCRHLTHLVFFSVEPQPDGSLNGLDRLPGPEVLASAYAGRQAFGTKLLLCLGGNGRSSGFSVAARDTDTRKRLVSEGACVCLRCADWKL